MTMSSSAPIVIVGGGLAGCMAAILLHRAYEEKGTKQKIIVLEGREDFRQHDRQDDEGGRLRNALKRSINLALSHRGICALKAAGLEQSIGAFDESSAAQDAAGNEYIIPMKGRLVHSLDGQINMQPYGTGNQAIYSISRGGLNKLLINKMEELGGDSIEIMFEAKVKNISKEGVITYQTSDGSNKSLQALFVVGADGAYSVVRNAIGRYSRLDYSMTYIKHGYKELTIPAKNGDYAMNPWQGLHIWPRQQFMLIALPNPDRSFTCTLFFPWTGPESIEHVQTDEDILNYFNTYFPDVIPIMPDLIRDFRQSPNSPLLTVRCDPYHYNDKLLLIGDAAHACVPFYGQGMNAAFEDGLLLYEVMKQCGNDHSRALPEFSRQRVQAGQALADLSLDNYIEMRAKTASTLFVLRKKLESVLHWMFPRSWIPLYTMVAFTRIPYDEAVRRGKRQDKILTWAAATTLTGLAAGLTVVGLKLYQRRNARL